MGEGANVAKRAIGVDMGGETAVGDRAVHMLNLERFVHHAFKGMQHHKAGAGGQEIGLRCGHSMKVQRTIGMAFDAGFVIQGLCAALTGGFVADDEAIGVLLHRQVAQHRRVSAPVFVTHQKGPHTQYFHTVQADVAQVAVVEFNRHRPSGEDLAFDIELLGAGGFDQRGGFR